MIYILMRNFSLECRQYSLECTFKGSSLVSGEGCFQPGARSWKGGGIWLSPKFVPDFVPDFVQTLSGLVQKIYWTDFDETLYIVYWYGLVVPPPGMERIGTPLHGFGGHQK